MKVLIISPSLEESGGRGLHYITNNIIDSLHDSGNQVGLLCGLPNHPQFVKHKDYDVKIDHVYLQHYMLEGAKSFRYVVKGGLSRFNVAKATIKRSIYKNRQVDINKELLSSKKTVLNSMDFCIQSPFFYQFLNLNKEKVIKKTISSICKDNKIDLIICTSPSLIHKKWVGKTRLVQFVHDFMPLEVLETPPDNDTPYMFAQKIYAACFGSDLLLANSEDTKSKILESNPNAQVEVLYGAVKSPASELDPSVLEKFGVKKDNYLVFASMLEKRKNLENIMKGYEMAFDSIGGMPFVIIGKAGYGFKDIYDGYESLSDKVKEKIVFTGYATEEDKISLFQGARACVAATIYEGLGIPIVEALACGIPVLASNTGASPEAGKDAALYVDNPYDIEEMSSGIIEIVNNDSTRARLMANAPAVVDFFSERNFRNRLASVVTKLKGGDI